MITEQLINYVDEKVGSLCFEKKRLRFWVYILLGISIVFVLILTYFSYRGKFNLY
jgi:hypothetical protein